MESLENTMELDAMPEYQTIKKVLRAILISGCARGMSTRELCAEYRNIEGQSIDYEQFGFTSLDMFLINMKDTVRWVRLQCDQTCRIFIIISCTETFETMKISITGIW